MLGEHEVQKVFSFYGISTIEGYLMPNPVLTYQICKYIF